MVIIYIFRNLTICQLLFNTFDSRQTTIQANFKLGNDPMCYVSSRKAKNLSKIMLNLACQNIVNNIL